MKKFVSIAVAASTIVLMGGMALMPGLTQAAQGPTHYWTMDETSGVRVDSAGNADLTPTGTVDYAPGILGNAASFGGTWGGRLSNPTQLISPSGVTTLAFWAYFDAVGPQVIPLFDDGGQFNVYFTQGRVGVEVLMSSGYSDASIPVPTGAGWKFIVAGWDGSQMKPFLSVNNSALQYGNQPVAFAGAGSTNFSNSVGGRIDDARMWSRYLTATEIADLYNAGATPTPTPAPVCSQYETQWMSDVGLEPDPMIWPSTAGATTDPSGNLYVAVSGRNMVRKFSPSGSLLMTIGAAAGGTTDGQFAFPMDVALDSAGNIYVADHQNHRIQKFDSAGNFVMKFGSFGSTNGLFNGPEGIAVDSAGNIYVSDFNNNRIQKFSSAGAFIKQVGMLGASPDLAMDASDNLYAFDSIAYKIMKFSSDLAVLAEWGSMGTGDGQFAQTARVGLAIGPDGRVYTTDSLNQRVQVFSDTGTFIAKWGTTGTGPGQFDYPTSIAVSDVGATSIYVTELRDGRIEKFGCATSPSPTPTVIEEVVNGKMHLNPGESVVLGPPTVLNGGLEGTSGNTVTVQNGYVRVDGSVKLLDTLVIQGGSTLEVTGGLEVTGTITIKQGGSLIVGGKFTCPGASQVIDEGHQTLDIGNNQCIQLVARGGGSWLAYAVLALAAGFGLGVFAKVRRVI